MELTGLLAALAIGLGVGIISSILGLGGGIVIVPLLPLAASLTPRETIGTSLLTVFFVTSVNAFLFHRRGLVSWSAGAVIGVAAGFGSYAAAKGTGSVPVFALHAGMALALALIAVFTLAPRLVGGIQLPNRSERQRRFSSAAIGLLSGVISGFTGIGGGVLITPLLDRLKTIEPRKVVPTANAAIVFTSLAGAFALVKAQSAVPPQGGESASLGLVRFDLAIALFLGAQLTSPFGRRYQSRLEPRKRDWLIGALLVALTVRAVIAARASL